jgi:hypothetical protein
MNKARRCDECRRWGGWCPTHAAELAKADVAIGDTAASGRVTHLVIWRGQWYQSNLSSAARNLT